MVDGYSLCLRAVALVNQALALLLKASDLYSRLLSRSQKLCHLFGPNLKGAQSALRIGLQVVDTHPNLGPQEIIEAPACLFDAAVGCAALNSALQSPDEALAMHDSGDLRLIETTGMTKVLQSQLEQERTQRDVFPAALDLT